MQNSIPSFVTVYTPNSSSGLKRLPSESKGPAFLEYIQRLDARKPVVVTGDLNVAHKAIDLARPMLITTNLWYTQDEIDGMSTLLKHANLHDTWRDESQSNWLFLVELPGWCPWKTSDGDWITFS